MKLVGIVPLEQIMAMTHLQPRQIEERLAKLGHPHFSREIADGDGLIPLPFGDLDDPATDLIINTGGHLWTAREIAAYVRDGVEPG
jgi:hypothetical protein